ncbi:MAG TPA: hypothetical protein ENN35_03210 [Deltaproteobacteria bacterium]|nr:hypothetical protein [Deltaproteobacteria bacterium]
MDKTRRQFMTGAAAVTGVSLLDGIGLFKASARAASAENVTGSKPSRELKDYPHITDVIRSRDMKNYFHLIVDACANPGENYLSRVPFLIELEVAKIWSESRFEWDAVSSAGAAGLQQLMASTARDYGLPVAKSNEIEAFNAAIAAYRDIKTSVAAKRQKLYLLAESGTGVMNPALIEDITAARTELSQLEEKRTAAYRDLRAVKKAYVEKIRSMTEKEREKEDARFAPSIHIPVGVKHLVRNITECRKFFGGPVEMNVWRGIASYNAGLSRVKTWGGFPFIEETVYYTRNIVSDLTRSLELKYAYSTGDPALVAETRKRMGLKEPYFVYVVEVGDNFYRIVREQLMERYDLSYSEALHYIRDSKGNTVDPDKMSIILPDQQFRIYVPE